MCFGARKHAINPRNAQRAHRAISAEDDRSILWVSIWLGLGARTKTDEVRPAGIELSPLGLGGLRAASCAIAA